MTARRRPARRRSRRLPRLTLGTTALAGVLLIATIRTWPIPATAAGALTTAALISRAVRPRRRRRPRPTQRRLPALLHSSAPRGAHTLANYQSMSPDQFEHAIADLARQHPDVRTATTHGGSGDRGLDVLVTLHDNRRILIQCKRYRPGNNIGSPVILHTAGAIRAHRCTTGVIVTTAAFTREAAATNSALGTDRLTLIDGTALTAWAAGGRAPWQ